MVTDTAFISASDAEQLHQSGQAVFLDCTYGQPIQYTIPAAIHFDIDDVANHHSPMPHMIPDTETFSTMVGAMGIDRNTHVIVFDKTGFWMAAARVWWMFRLFGHANIHIMNGGLGKWMGDLAPYAPPLITQKIFQATFQDHLYQSYDQMTSQSDDDLIVDARAPQAFMAGHMTNAISIPLPMIINPDATIKPQGELRPILSAAIESGARIVTSCNSGVTACALAAAFYECGHHDVAVYDGSWCEWQSKQPCI